MAVKYVAVKTSDTFMASGLAASGIPALTPEEARRGLFSGDPTAKHITPPRRRSVRFLSRRAGTERAARAESVLLSAQAQRRIRVDAFYKILQIRKNRFS